MNVQELIDKLTPIYDKTIPVFIVVDGAKYPKDIKKAIVDEDKCGARVYIYC